MKFRSGFEKRIYEDAQRRGRQLSYEERASTLFYTRPASKHRYLPDFKLQSGILVESKGRFTAPDRAKILRVISENPGVDLRLLFQRANQRLTKAKNSMTYAEWADKHGITWHQGDSIPDDWF